MRLLSENIKTIVRTVLIFVFSGLLCYSTYVLINREIETYKCNMLKKQLADIYNGASQTEASKQIGLDENTAVTDSQLTKPSAEITPSKAPEIIKEESPVERFKRLSEVNKDIKAWIKVNNTNIDYPVVQAKNNSYYLDRDINKKYSYTGSIFMDYRCNIGDLKCKNIILYGHNMKNDIMFHELPKFRKKNFFKDNNNTIIIDTSDGSYKCVVFSAYLTDLYFDYLKTSFNSSKEYNDFIKTISEKSLYRSEIKVTGKDRILTLSTCAYDFEDARFVVHAKILNTADGK